MLDSVKHWILLAVIFFLGAIALLLVKGRKVVYNVKSLGDDHV